MKPLITCLSIATLACGAVTAHAASEFRNDALTGPAPSVSITQAIAAAEAHLGGTARNAQYEKTARGWAYDVEIAKGDTVYDVAVDPHTGAVVRSTRDTADCDDADDDVD
ncbi:PepSY domain-containing protein [Nitrogeniibacter mangrovi]|uniref:PepSY domain-containing protein n=1 Tax=Nitrogeniibacter mangrovi TaxID=2016596 RepID=A0A6C1B681_9RHOO|nr:PepSY domain-containing protein [Nitrogeniibacter mangrovi]QID18305.1 PepSY domain-containing protein [Nitrogeniibacter mangrovi]